MRTLLLLWSACAMAQTAANPAGHWEGKVQLGEREVALSVDLARDSKNAWIGSMTAAGSTSVDVPLEEIAADGGKVRFVSYLPIRAQFEGSLSADGTNLSGTASNMMGQAKFELKRAGEAKVNTPPPSSELTKDFEGTWEGSISAGGTVLHLRLILSAAGDGLARAKLISVDQGNMEFPATTVAIQGKQLGLDVRPVSGKYSGTLGAGGEIAGTWEQGGARMDLTLHRPGVEKKP